MTKRKILVACEYSGQVREAFRALGHDAWSCDLLPTEIPGKHIQGDVLKVIADGGFDLLCAHPPCTYLCNSGVRWLVSGGVLNPERYELMRQACEFFAALYHCKIPRVAIENPVMHGYAKMDLLSRGVPGHSCTLQPWQHGEPEVKRTCLWLRNLPPIVPSNIVEGRAPRVHHASPGPDRWKARSRTLPGVARALAAQWSQF